MEVPPNLNDRRWLATLIAGHALSVEAVERAPTQALLDCAREEGVVMLVHDRLRGIPQAVALRAAFTAAARDEAVASLLRETECRRLLDALESARIPVLLLKGSALAWWLYPSAELRECSDIDLLFASREHAEAAAQALVALGYAFDHRPDDMAYELLCRRQSGSLRFDIDIHWRLANLPLFAEAFDFQELADEAIVLDRLAAKARGLGPVHAFMHACIHRAANASVGIGDHLKWLYDIHLLGERLSPAEWTVLLERCRTRGLSGVCVSAIEAAAGSFGAMVPDDVIGSLRSTAGHEAFDAHRLHDWTYMQSRNLAALPSLRARARWLWQRAFPPAAYLRALYGADRGLASLWMQRARNAVGRLRP